MRVPLFSLGILLSLTLIFTGCGGGDKKETPAQDANAPGSTDAQKTETSVTTSGTTSHPSQEAVKKFLAEMLSNNTTAAFAFFTPKAQQEYARTNSSLDPRQFMGMEFRITGGDVLPESDGTVFAVYVDMIDEEAGEQVETVWCVRKIGNEYRIANLMMNFEGQFVTLDFEDPSGTMASWAEEETAAPQTTAVPQTQTGMQQPVNPQVAQQNQFATQQFPQQQPSANPMQQTPQFNAPTTFQPPIPQQTAQPNIPTLQ